MIEDKCDFGVNNSEDLNKKMALTVSNQHLINRIINLI
jgi:hypothetical protein